MPLKIKPVLGHLYFDEVNADNMYQLNSLIEDTEKDKQYVKEKLKMLVAATPKDIFSKEDDEDSNDILFKLNREFDELWEMLESSSYDNAKLSIISELIDEYKYMSDENKLDPEKQSDFDRITLKESNKPNIVFNGFSQYECKDNSLADIENRADENFDAVSKHKYFEGKVIVYYKGKLFVDSDENFLFDNEKEAIKALKTALDIHACDFVEKAYIEKHKDLLNDLKKYVDYDNLYVNSYIKKENKKATMQLFDECVEYVLNPNNKEMKEFYFYLLEMLENAIDNFFKEHIVVKRLF